MDKDPPELSISPRSTLDIVAQKYRASSGAMLVAARGSTQVDPRIMRSTLELFYNSLYRPDSLEVATAAEYCDYADNRQVISMPVANLPAPLDLKTFINEASSVLLHHTDYERCLYPGAMDALTVMMNRGQVVVWTQGVVAEQMAKTVKVGIAEKRANIAAEKNMSTERRKELLTFGGSLDKLGDIERWADQLVKNGVETIIVVEDRVSNIIAALDILKKKGINAIPIWVRQGRHGLKSPPEGVKPEDLNAINSISEFNQQFLEKLVGDHKCGFLMDLDGVVCDDDIRFEVQSEALAQWLLNMGKTT